MSYQRGPDNMLYKLVLVFLLLALCVGPAVYFSDDIQTREIKAAVRPVPETSRLLVSNGDREEIYMPIREKAWLVSIVIFLLIAAAGLNFIFWWRQKSSEYLRKQQEAELQRNALLQQYDYLSRYANDIVVLVDHDRNARIIEVNDRAVSAYGYSREELLQMTVRDLCAPETLGDVEDQLKQVRSKNGFIYETIQRRKDGTIFPVEISSRVIETGGRRLYQGIIRDTTERKQAEQALKDSEHRYKRLVESVTDYIYSVEVQNGQAASTHHGPGCISVTGYTSEEYQADRDLWHRMVFEEDKAFVVEQATKILSGATVPPFEHRIIHKDGSLRWVKNTPVPRHDHDGRLIAYDGLITDITTVKMLENQLRQAQKMEAVGQLAGGIAHDFNNILTAIIGYANLLLMRMPRTDVGRTYLDQILSSAERAAHLTRSLLAFSRKQIIDLKPVNVNEVITRVEKLLCRVIGEDIEFKTRLSRTDQIILADSVQIEQILMNLATNARDAMPDGGTLTVETDSLELGEEFVRNHSYGKPGKYALIAVTDTGIGMDEKVRNRIFEPFFTTKEVGKGTGLGLAMVYGIVKQHNGYIHVYSEPARGTAFKIYLPLIASTADKESEHGAENVKGGLETVLLAEDDSTVRTFMKHVLENFGYRVIEAADGEEAVRKFEENKEGVDLLVLDIIMPKKNGRETYQEIKKIRPAIRALLTSGYTADVVHQKGIMETGLDFILKPSTPTVLLKKVREVLDKPKAE